MNKIKLGSFEAIAVILTITIAHSILTLPKSIITSVGSSTLINVAFVSIVAFIFCLVIYKLLSKFPGLDIIDISYILGGKVLQTIVGILFLAYIIFISSVLLRIFANCLQIVYYPMTDLIFIISLFIIGTIIACTFKSIAAFRSTIVIVPIVVLSILFLFVANTKYFNFENVFPILGNGASATFGSGLSNLFAFGGIMCLYLLPPMLKKQRDFKKITVVSIVISAIYLLFTVATILFMFNSFSFTDQLMPLYSAVRHIEFGTFFQRLDSLFLLIWILSFFCYLGCITNFSMGIFKKVTNVKSTKLVLYPFLFIILGLSLLPKDEAIVEFLESTVYKYAFLIFIVGICLCLLLLATFKNKRKKEKSEE